MYKVILVIVMVLFMNSGYAQQKPAYVLYNSQGKKVSYEKMLKTLMKKEVLLFGEFHNNAIAHWLQLELTKDLGALKDLVLGAEMFEHDNQPALDLYLSGKITARGLDSAARLWQNYKTDYAPLVNYAKENKLSFAATNVPRRFASLVSRAGFAVLDTLTAIEKSWIAPLPVLYDSTLPGYKNMMDMMPGHGAVNFPKAQALKDATMAYFILKYFVPGKTFIHYNGAYHSDNYEGIGWYLQQYRPATKVGTISTVSQKDVKKLLPENRGKADFIICVDEDMTSTY